MFTSRKMAATVFAVGKALEQHPEAAKAMVEVTLRTPSCTESSLTHRCPLLPPRWITGRLGDRFARLPLDRLPVHG
jgi:hypothetical protein